MQIFFQSEFFICLTTPLHYDDFFIWQHFTFYILHFTYFQFKTN